MTRTEERLRDALAGTARTVQRRDLRPLETPVRRRFTAVRWFAPVAAAASIAVLVVISSVVLGPLADRGGTPPGGPGSAQTRAAMGAPPYFVVLEGARKLSVRDAATGKAVARTKPPSGTEFQSVAGTGDPRTFIVAAGEAPCRSRILRLRVSENGGLDSLDRLTTVASDVQNLAVTRDGGRIAFTSGGLCSRLADVTVVDLDSGPFGLGERHQTWGGPKVGGSVAVAGQTSVSWAGDGHTLFFSWYQPPNARPRQELGAQQVRALDTRGQVGDPGSDLLSARVVVADVGDGLLVKAAVGPDGRTVLAALSKNPWGNDPPDGVAIVAFSGGRHEVVAEFPESGLVDFDLDSTGKHLLVHTDRGLGRIDDGTYEPIGDRKTVPDNLVDFAW